MVATGGVCKLCSSLHTYLNLINQSLLGNFRSARAIPMIHNQKALSDFTLPLPPIPRPSLVFPISPFFSSSLLLFPLPCHSQPLLPSRPSFISPSPEGKETFFKGYLLKLLFKEKFSYSMNSNLIKHPFSISPFVLAEWLCEMK